MSAPAEFLGGDGGRGVQQIGQANVTPIRPRAGSLADLALHDLLQGPLTQRDWLQAGKSWRLAAAVGDLREMGWPVIATMVRPASGGRPVALYALHRQAIDAARAAHG